MWERNKILRNQTVNKKIFDSGKMHKLVEMDKNENNTNCEIYQDYFSDEEKIDDEEIPLSGSHCLLCELHHQKITH